jgi:hypothetical protein
MTLADFTSKVKTEGLAKSNRYVVVMTLPPILAGIPGVAQAMALYTTEVQIPGVAIEGTAVNTGLHTILNPTTLNFDPCNISFYDDGDFVLKQFFDVWVSNIINFDDKVISWKDDYVATMEIHRLDEQNNMKYKIKLHEVFPVSIGAQSLAYGAGRITTQPITFKYTRWTTEQIDNSSQRRSGGLNATSDIFSDIIGNQKLSIPGMGSGGFFDNLKKENSWIDAAYRTAGDVVGAYQQGRNVFDQIKGTGKLIQTGIGLAKNAKSLDGLIKAGSGLGSIFDQTTRQTGGVLDNIRKATIAIPAKLPQLPNLSKFKLPF